MEVPEFTEALVPATLIQSPPRIKTYDVSETTHHMI